MIVFILNNIQKARCIKEEIFEFCAINEKVTVGELEDNIAECIDEDFNTRCEDGSINGTLKTY